jgi:hypothetical protein
LRERIWRLACEHSERRRIPPGDKGIRREVRQVMAHGVPLIPLALGTPEAPFEFIGV